MEAVQDPKSSFIAPSSIPGKDTPSEAPEAPTPDKDGLRELVRSIIRSRDIKLNVKLDLWKKFKAYEACEKNDKGGSKSAPGSEAGNTDNSDADDDSSVPETQSSASSVSSSDNGGFLGDFPHLVTTCPQVPLAHYYGDDSSSPPYFSRKQVQPSARQTKLDDREKRIVAREKTLTVREKFVEERAEQLWRNAGAIATMLKREFRDVTGGEGKQRGKRVKRG
jgi:hypothetical protein